MSDRGQDKKKSAESLEKIKAALTELLDEDFAYVSIVALRPAKRAKGDLNEDTPTNTSVMAWGHGGVDPVPAHLMSVKALLGFGNDNYNMDDADPAFFAKLFGVNLPPKPPGGPTGEIFRP